VNAVPPTVEGKDIRGGEETMYSEYRADDEPEEVFRKAVESASRMLWALGSAEDCLAALYDVLEASVGEQGLQAALEARSG
jgi:hypothetical protein